MMNEFRDVFKSQIEQLPEGNDKMFYIVRTLESEPMTRTMHMDIKGVNLSDLDTTDAFVDLRFTGYSPSTFFPVFHTKLYDATIEELYSND